jgi:hypothetical protein
MKKEIALLLIIAASIAGFFLGRRFPMHRFVYYQAGDIAFDSTTGKLCDPEPHSKPVEKESSRADGRSIQLPPGYEDAKPLGNGLKITDDDSRLPPCGGK